MNRKAVSPVIAIVLLLMMTVAAAGAAYFWLTRMQSGIQEQSTKSIENIMQSAGRRVVAQATLCKPTYPYKGLKGYWAFEDAANGEGTEVEDWSGDNNNGTKFDDNSSNADGDTPAQLVNGQVGKALEFDGTDDYVEVPDDPSLNPENKITVSHWFKQTRVSDYYHLWTVWKGGGYGPLWGFEIAHGDTDSPRIQFDVADSDFNTNMTPGFHYDIGRWYHATGVYDGSRLILYINGSKIGTKKTPFYDTSGRNLLIGYWGGWGGKYFPGIIDEVRIYNRALSENEIKELYEAENHSARRRIDVTVRNIGSEDIPKATWVANLKQDGTTVETDAYNASSIDTGELATLKFYFKNFKPNTEYTIELQGTGTSTTVSC